MGTTYFNAENAKPLRPSLLLQQKNKNKTNLTQNASILLYKCFTLDCENLTWPEVEHVERCSYAEEEHLMGKKSQNKGIRKIGET